MIFNDTVTNQGLYQAFLDFTSNTASTGLLQRFTRGANNALDRTTALIIQSNDNVQWDDTNFNNFPIGTFDIVNGQREYSLLDDADGNRILKILRMAVKDSNGIFHDIEHVEHFDPDADRIFKETGGTGVPTMYDHFGGTGIIFDKTPNYASVNGGKILYQRTGSYFLTTDTTKEPGFADPYHLLIALYPAYYYAISKGLNNIAWLREEIAQHEKGLVEFYQQRAGDRRHIMTAHIEEPY